MDYFGEFKPTYPVGEHTEYNFHRNHNHAFNNLAEKRTYVIPKIKHATSNQLGVRSPIATPDLQVKS